MKAPESITLVLENAANLVAAWGHSDLIGVGLVLCLGVALGAGFVSFLLVLHHLRCNRLAARRKGRMGNFPGGHRPTLPCMFTLPSHWLAIKSSKPRQVMAALRLNKPTLCSWEEGLTAANERKLFIAPPVAGWILVFGSSLPEPARDVDRVFHFILGLSRKLGHVQYFSMNHQGGHHSWVQAENGRVRRAYAWAGATLWHQGSMTRSETRLGMRCLNYCESREITEEQAAEIAVANAEKVPQLAACWSLDPAALKGRMFRESHGIAGELSRFKVV